MSSVTAPPSDPFGKKLLHVQDQKAANTAGGTFTSGAWRTRDINTVLTNEIAGASLASNQITLPAGTYHLEASISSHACNYHKALLYNVTDAANVLIGQSCYSAAGSVVEGPKATVSGRFTITGTKVFELRHRCISTRATDGYGYPTNVGVNEVYLDGKIWRIR